MREYQPESIPVVDADPNRTTMIQRTKSGRYAIMARYSIMENWIQVASRAEWPMARDEAAEYHKNDRLRSAAIRRMIDDRVDPDDWGDDRFDRNA